VKGINGKVLFAAKLVLSLLLLYLVIAKAGLGGIAASLRTVGPSLGAALALALLGGAAWVRARINRAKEPE
jgi:hypothetical protein